MEYLVTMTTHVPDRTPDAAVDDIRSREAAHTKELAAEGHLLRLWRPPLQPGEWRTLGLFDAADAAELETVLESMPLRIWRTDEVTPLLPHPNDPGPPTRGAGSSDTAEGGSEFFTTFTITIPPDTPASAVDAMEAREADRTGELAAQRTLLRLWALAGERRSLGLWFAQDAEDMGATMDSLPLRAWLDVQTTQLTPHPSDPASTPG